MGVAVSRRLCSTMTSSVIRPLIFCGPSGVGKSTLLNRLQNEFPGMFGFSVSHTTRKPREKEENGVHYHFVNREYMEQAIQRGEFIEHAEYGGNLYGTSKAEVYRIDRDGAICILDIDVQGVIQVKKSDLKPYCVFVRPPSMEALETRLRGRGTETDESLQRRLAAAAAEMKFGETPGNVDIVIINDDLTKAYQQLRDFVQPIVEQKRRQTTNGVS